MLLNVDPRWVRLSLRKYFDVVFVFVAIVGDSCVVYSTKLQILNRNKCERESNDQLAVIFEPCQVSIAGASTPYRPARESDDCIGRAVLR